jgi:hypothetical protein
LISSNFSCWSLYCLSCELPFWLPLWYLQTFLVGHCIACHVTYHNDQQEKFEDIKGVIRTVNHMTWNTMTNKKSLKISKGNQNGKSHDWVPVLITPVISSNFSCWSLYCLSCDLPFWLPFDIFKLFLLVIVFHVMWFTVLITTNKESLKISKG